MVPEMTDAEYADLLADVRAHGILVPIDALPDGRVLDGRHRLRAARECGLDDVPVLTRNLDERAAVEHIGRTALLRRNLTAGQKAAVVLSSGEWLGRLRGEIAAAANRKRAEAAAVRPRDALGRLSHHAPSLSLATLPGTGAERAVPCEVAPTIARAAGISARTAQDVMTVKERDPALFAEVLAGKIAANKAARTVRAREREADAHQIEGQAEAAPGCGPTPEAGQFWQLGRHILYCGDTGGEEFIARAPQEVAFAFADPPYNAGVASWDFDFEWRHDWLAEKAAVVAVTPGIASLADFFRVTHMPYRWTLAYWIANGMARGAVGFGNWNPVPVFTMEKSINRSAQDFLKISIHVEATPETTHKGRKQPEVLLWLFGLFATAGAGAWVIDPFLGSGTTLLAAEQSGRRCYGGEVNPAYCAEIIARWQAATGERAELVAL